MLSALILLLTAPVAPGQEIHHGDSKKHHMPRSAQEYAMVLDNPQRDEWQKPHEVVTALELRPGSTVADIGAGTGYFALRFAHHLGPSGKVLAVDIDEELLRDHVAKRAAAMKLTNVETVLASARDPHLRAESADLVFICDVIHHIDERPAYYQLLARALKPGGRLAIVDFHKKPLPVGPSVEHKIAREDLIRELQGAGFRLSREHTFLPHQYFLVFDRAS